MPTSRDVVSSCLEGGNLIQWSTIHKYNALVKQGTIRGYECRHCTLPLITQSNNIQEPYFWCVSCDRKIYPGLEMERELKNIVREHYL